MTKWHKPPIDGSEVRTLASTYNLDMLSAAILVRRNMVQPQEIAFLLEEDERFLHNPFLFPQMEQAVERVLEAVESQEKVFIFGDKDIDGITSTVLMVEALRSVGLYPEWRVPLGDEDYGLNLEVIKSKAAEGVTLLITVDCGVTDYAGVELAASLGMDVLIFDHHTPRNGDLPSACAVINPKIAGTYPFEGLCAAAVVSKFQWALCLAGTELWGQENCIIHAWENAESGSSSPPIITIEAISMRNLKETGSISVNSGEGDVGRERLLSFIEGQVLFVYGLSKQKPLISKFFGGAEVYTIDIAESIVETFPVFRGKTLTELEGLSRLSRYFPEMGSGIRTLKNLLITLYYRKLSSHFDLWRRGLDLAAIATLADIMPLVNENRILVRKGLKRLNAADGIPSRRIALRELIFHQQMHEGFIGTVELSWKLCPLINASGRMGQADIGVEMFLADDELRIRELAAKLVDLNKKRKSLGDSAWERLLPAARQVLKTMDNRMIILADTEIPRGITGILANRFQKVLGLPSVILSRRGEHASGSIRCKSDMNAMKWLEAMAHLLDDYGGHPQAGGFQIASSKIDALIDETRQWLREQEPLPAHSEPIIIDAELSPAELAKMTPGFLNELLKRFEPYGESFSPLTFLTRGVPVHKVGLVGKPVPNHLKLSVSLGKEKWSALWWDSADRLGKDIKPDTSIDIVYHIDKEHWRGAEAQRLTILEASLCTSQA